MRTARRKVATPQRQPRAPLYGPPARPARMGSRTESRHRRWHVHGNRTSPSCLPPQPCLARAARWRRPPVRPSLPGVRARGALSPGPSSVPAGSRLRFHRPHQTPPHTRPQTQARRQLKGLLGKPENEVLPFATTWMDLEGIVLGEISQIEKDKYHMLSLLCGI